jgi:PAS domain S-box-containing protein
MTTESAPGMEATTRELQRKVEEYERWFRFLDGQNRVLERERQKLTAILANTDAGFAILDPSNSVVWANENFASRFAKLPAVEEAVGAPCHRLVCGREAPCPECPSRQALETGGVAHREIEKESDGARRQIYASAMPIRSPFGNSEETLLMLQDVTELQALRRAEEALRAEEELYRTTFDDAGVGMVTVGPDGRFLRANAAFCSFLGYAHEDVLRLGLADVTLPEDLPGLQLSFQEGIEGLRPTLEIEKKCLKQDGTTVWGRVTASFIRNASGRSEGCVAFVQDITERKRAEAALRESETRLRLLVEQMPAILWSTDRDLRFTWSVGAGLAGLGLEPNQVIGTSLYEFFGTSDPVAQPIASHVRAIAGDSVSYQMLWRGRSYQVHVEPFRGVDGAVVGSIGVALDTTDRNNAEDALRRSEARKTAILETVLDGIISLDDKGRITEMNSAAERMFGHLREEALGKPLVELIVPPSSRGEDWLQFALLPGDSGGSAPGWRFEMTAVHSDGSEFPVEMSVARIPTDSVPSFTAYIRDLTSRKLAREALREREEQLRHSQKMDAIGTLAGGVAHDFNNLLTGILGQAELLRLSPRADEKMLESVGIIERAARRAAELTQQLLGFARRGKHQSVPVDLHAAAREVMALLKRTVDKNIWIVDEFRSSHPWVLGDPEQLQQVILNLAVNARDAMPDGGELVIGTAESPVMHAAGGGAAPARVELFVRDSGRGIPEEIRDKVFEPFFTTKEQGKGTGMGLAMVYGIVKNHGGSVRFDTEAGHGTTFCVLLPVAPRPAIPPSLPLEKAAVRGTGRVFVVDDEEVVREVASQYLQILGYEVMVARDGLEAVEIYRNVWRDIDLVLIDMMMPRMAGRECFRELRSINPEVRAVLSTGFGINSAAQEILDDGMSGFVHKPYGIQQLSEVVARALAAPAVKDR